MDRPYPIFAALDAKVFFTMRGVWRLRTERGSGAAAKPHDARATRASLGTGSNSFWTRAPLIAGALAVALTTGGCVAAAIPMAIEAAASLGSGVAHIAEAGVISSHEGSYETAVRKEEVCDDLTSEIPLLTELRTDQSGKTLYRQLSLTGAQLEPQWVAVSNHDNGSGWKLAGNFTHMDFQPPIQPLLTADSVLYIAYARVPARDATQQDELNALMVGFGPKLGTFRWHDQIYKYAAVRKLPCFPPPSQ
jgi:hypothetical protein